MSRMTARQMARLPWTFKGPVFMQPRLDETFFELRITELPDFFLAGVSVEAVLNELPAALEAFLQSYLDAGEDPPLPADRQQWILGRPPRSRAATPAPTIKIAENLSFT